MFVSFCGFTFHICSIRENNDFKKIIHYLQHLDMNSNLNVIFEYAKEPLMSDPSALSIFIENPREVTVFLFDNFGFCSDRSKVLIVLKLPNFSNQYPKKSVKYT